MLASVYAKSLYSMTQHVHQNRQFCSLSWTLMLACQLPKQAINQLLRMSEQDCDGRPFNQTCVLSGCVACHLLPIEAHATSLQKLSSSYTLGQLLINASSKRQPHIMYGRFRCSIPYANRRNCTEHFISSLVSRVYRVCLIPTGVSLHIILVFWVTCKPAVSNYYIVVSFQAYRGCTQWKLFQKQNSKHTVHVYMKHNSCTALHACCHV